MFIHPLAHHRCVKTMIAQLGGRSDRQPSEGSDAFDAIPRLVEDAQDRNPLLTDRGRAFRSRVLCRDLHSPHSLMRTAFQVGLLTPTCLNQYAHQR